MRKKLSRSGMKKKKRKRNRKERRTQHQGTDSEQILPEGGISWMENDGLHAIMPGEKPSEEQIQKITEQYQRKIRKSPLFKQWVKQYGKSKAARMLKECRFEVR